MREKSVRQLKQESLSKYSTKEAVLKKWIGIFKNINKTDDTLKLSGQLMEAINLLDVVIENVLGAQYNFKDFYENLEKLREPYKITDQDIEAIKFTKRRRNKAAHMTESIVMDLITYDKAVESLKTVGTFIYKMGYLDEETIIPDDTLLKADAGDELDGNFILEALIGEGASGRVFKATQKRLGKTVAIKEIHHHLLDEMDLENEKQMLLKLKHYNIPNITDILHANRTIYLVMDFIDGETLESYINKIGRVSTELLQKIMGQLCDILEYLHNFEGGVLYRDLKPSNIMIDKNKDVHLIDFGISIDQETQEDRSEKFSGTPLYASPEQLRGERLDARSDIFALGNIVYFMVEGQHPSEILRYGNDVDNRIKTIIDKATAKDKGNRYSSVKALAKAIDGLSMKETVTVKDNKGTSPKRQSSKRIGKFVPLIIGAIIVLFAGSQLIGMLNDSSFNPMNARKVEAIMNDNYEIADKLNDGDVVVLKEDQSIQTVVKDSVELKIESISVDDDVLILNGEIYNKNEDELRLFGSRVYILTQGGQRYPMQTGFSDYSISQYTSNGLVAPGQRLEFSLGFDDYDGAVDLTLYMNDIMAFEDNDNFEMPLAFDQIIPADRPEEVESSIEEESSTDKGAEAATVNEQEAAVDTSSEEDTAQESLLEYPIIEKRSNESIILQIDSIESFGDKLIVNGVFENNHEEDLSLFSSNVYIKNSEGTVFPVEPFVGEYSLVSNFQLGKVPSGTKKAFSLGFTDYDDSSDLTLVMTDIVWNDRGIEYEVLIK